LIIIHQNHLIMAQTEANEVKRTGIIYTPAEFLDLWQGHRRLTRRMIEAFPEDKLFTYSIGGMRPFSELVFEFIGMAWPGVTGIRTGEWKTMKYSEEGAPDKPKTKAELLGLWDKTTDKINYEWNQTGDERFLEHDVSFGQWPGTVYSFVQYWMDNEIHHRGQAYVYLRSLNIEPPAFYDRS
jgi:uncharacterized damage-inducible protein DinB